ncbi:MAG: hypothetical protein HY344_04560 [Candidatus Levybacteria bacterium]|nr:hypothetical protein [Candidatus Levybacteria bacterium]
MAIEARRTAFGERLQKWKDRGEPLVLTQLGDIRARLHADLLDGLYQLREKRDPDSWVVKTQTRQARSAIARARTEVGQNMNSLGIQRTLPSIKDTSVT